MAPGGTADRLGAGVVNVLVILQGPAHGNERAYNRLRLATELGKRDDVTARPSSLAEVADWVLWADKTVTF